MSDSLVRVTRRVEWGAHRPMPGARRCRSPPEGARCQPRSGRRRLHRRNKGLGLGRRLNPHRSMPQVDRRTGSSPFHIRLGHIAGPHPLPSRQFQALLDSLFKVLFIFPSRYLFAIGLSPIFSLGQNLPPDWGCIPKQPDSLTAPRGRGGRRGGFNNGEAADGERPRRTFERHSGTGRGNEFKREGSGRGNWGRSTDEFAEVAEEAVNETEKNVGDEKPIQEDDTSGVNTENPAKEPEETEPEDKEMTLEEYEKLLEDKRKALLALKTE